MAAAAAAAAAAGAREFVAVAVAVAVSDERVFSKSGRHSISKPREKSNQSSSAGHYGGQDDDAESANASLSRSVRAMPE